MKQEFSPLLHLLNKIATVQLNTQYRMKPDISAVENVVSHINICTRIMPHDGEQMMHPERGVGAPTIILDGLLAAVTTTMSRHTYMFGSIC